MADRYWVGGTANWDGTAGTKWATSSGGAGGASVPTSADDVFFDGASGAVTCTVSAAANCKNLTFTGFTGTFAGTSPVNTFGNVVVATGMTWTHTGTLQFTGGVTQTLTSNGKTLSSLVQITTSGTTLSLSDALTVTTALTLTQGTFTTNNFNVTATSLSSSNSNTRTINLGSSTVTFTGTGAAINFSTQTGLTFNAGTSSIVLSGSGAGVSFSATGGATFYNLSLTSTTTSSASMSGTNTFNNLSVAAPASAGVKSVTFAQPSTINGTLSTTGTAGNRRVWFQGSTYGIAQTLTINSAPSLTDADFRDIYVIGTAAPISGTRIGDLRGIRGITASTPKSVYWVTAAGGNWSANNWAPSSGGGASTDNFPLAQDTAVIENTGLNTSATVTLDSAIGASGLALPSVNMSARTNAMTLATGAVAPTIYGSWTNGSGTSITGSAFTFSGRNTQTITSAGKTFPGNFIIDSYGGTVELADALNIGSNTLTVTNGTFDTKNYNVTASLLSSSNSNVRTITLGSSTVTLSSTPVTFTTSTNLTFNAGTSTISATSSASYNFNGGGVTFHNVTLNNGASAISNIIGANTFNNLTITPPASASIGTMTFAANQTITGTLTVAGATAVRRNFLRSDTLGTTRTLTVGTLSATDCDFRDITIAGTAAGSSPTRAGDCGGNTGITFPAPKTVYWNLAGSQNWSATAWAPGSGGTPDINNFPLAQDTAVFDEAAGSVTGTITIDAAWNIGTFDASARTSAMTLTTSTNAPLVYGDWKFGTGVTSSSTTGELTFAKRGTQTITCNGVTFGCPVTIRSFGGKTQLGDALLVNSARNFTHANGEFDAVTYNVTIKTYNNTGGQTLRMGSGTWTQTGSSGEVWNSGVLVNFYKGTADILLSDTSTASRTFAGGGLSYNKLTIGGTTGTSTTTISGNNQFTELASTKTVAHTIALGSTTQTFGKWTVTGTSGNVVTLTGTGTSHVLAGACTDSIDYLAMGSIGFAATSPGEFYAGANSTGTAAAPVYRTAKPADSTRYWVGGTGNWSDTARWSTSSGGSSGASVPRSHDDVVFDSASNATAYTATVNTVTGGIRCKALTIAGPASGNLTLAGSTAIDGIHGNVTLPATGLTRTYTGAITLTGSTSGKTLTTNGVTLASAITVNGVNCEWTLGSALNIGTSSQLDVRNGSFDCNNYNLTAGSMASSYGHSRTINLGSGTITIHVTIAFGTTETNAANLTFNAGTSQLTFPSSVSLDGNGKTFHNVSWTLTSSASTATITGANTFNNFTSSGLSSAGFKFINLSANQTINGTLTLSAGTNATMRHFVRSNAIGTTRTLTCAAFSGTDADFRDITIAGVAAPATGTRIGDCKGNSGITFTAAANKYWNLAVGGNWSDTGWALSSGASPAVNNFPLAQDTCVFEATGLNSGASITLDETYNIGTIDMSARTTNTMTFSTPVGTFAVYGNWINGTGTTLSGTNTIIFAGRGTQTITSAGQTFTHLIRVENPGGTVTLQDALTASQSTSDLLNITSGTFDASSFNVTLSGATSAVNSSNSNVRTIAIGSGTWSIAGSGNAWNTGTSTNLTVTGTGTISLTSASAKTFAGGGIAYTDITLNQGGAGTLTITGNNTFKDITNTYKATGATTISLGTTTQRVSQWTAAGEAGRVLTVQGTSASSPGTLVLTGATDPNVDYLTITGVRAYDLTTTWYAGANSTNNGSLGWYFESGTISISASFQDTATGSDQVSAVVSFASSFQDTVTASDQVAALAVLLADVSDTATATDEILGGSLYLSDFSDTATGTDSVLVAASTFNAPFSDSVTITDTNVGFITFPATIDESATGTDSDVGFLTLPTTIDESATGTDTASSAQTFAVSLAEQASGADETLVAPSTFNVTVPESVQTVDVFIASAIFPVSIAEQIAMADTLAGNYLWNLIDDSQNANWQNVNNTQNPIWTDIDDSQSSTWTPVIP